MKRDIRQELVSVIKIVDLSTAAVFWIVAVIVFLSFIGYGVYLAAHNVRF